MNARRVLKLNQASGWALTVVIRLLLAGAPALVTAGCSHIPLGAMTAFRGVDPLKADVSGLRVALVVPKAVRLAAEPRLVLATILPGQPRVETPIAFVDARDEQDIEAPRGDDGRKVTIYELDPAQAHLLREFQQNVLAMKAAGIHGHAEVTVDAKICNERQDAPTEGVDVYLRLAADQGYVKVLRDLSADELTTALSRTPGTTVCP